ncbi:hypothetical protein BYT27DRAFT_7213083 [Phlegmacium glaucopus]|nr:hypothetical protein BYT27DRAFT_7213083 [Phlegmacium glaucopus]
MSYSLVNEQLTTDRSPGELLEGPTTPLKKCLRKTPPPPGSEAFNLLEAVSASHILASAMSGAGSTTPRVEFGSVVRVIVKTEKAKAIEAVTKMPSRRPLKPSAVQSLTAGKSSTSTATKAYMEPAPADAESFSLVELSDDDIPDMAQVFSDIQRMKAEGKREAFPLSASSEHRPTPLPDLLDAGEWSDSGASEDKPSMAVETAVAVTESVFVAASITQQRTKLMLGICPSLTDKLMPLHIWGVMGAARKQFLAGCSGYPRTSQKTCSGLGTWAFGISPEYQPETDFSGWPFRIPPEYRPEQMVLAAGGRSGCNPMTSQNTHFLGSAWDIIRNQPENTFWLGIRAFGMSPKYQPEKTEHTFSGRCSGYYPRISQKTCSGWVFGHSGYHPNTNQKRRFWLGVRDTTQQPARADIFWLVLGVLSKNQPENTFGLGVQDITQIPARKHVRAGCLGYPLNTSQKPSFFNFLRILPAKSVSPSSCA